MPDPARYVGTAGWNIPRAVRGSFAIHGSQLERYASRLNAAEINTTFYRSHAPAIYERWARAVPSGFRFAVKMPKHITHERGLARCRDPLTKFLDDITALGPTLGPLLVQLAPSFPFERRRIGRFFELLRGLHTGAVVCEPRHASWASPEADRLLNRFRIARVAADPPRVAAFARPGGWPGIAYFRWHGSPRPYFSAYPRTTLGALAAEIAPIPTTVWTIFDNTGSGAAAANALELTALV